MYPKSIAFNQLDYITDKNGRIAVNYIGRFENLNVDFKKVCNTFGVRLELPHKNAFDRKNYHEYYNAIDIDQVKMMYKEIWNISNMIFKYLDSAWNHRGKLGNIME